MSKFKRSWAKPSSSTSIWATVRPNGGKDKGHFIRLLFKRQRRLGRLGRLDLLRQRLHHVAQRLHDLNFRNRHDILELFAQPLDDFIVLDVLVEEQGQNVALLFFLARVNPRVDKRLPANVALGNEQNTWSGRNKMYKHLHETKCIT